MNTTKKYTDDGLLYSLFTVVFVLFLFTSISKEHNEKSLPDRSSFSKEISLTNLRSALPNSPTELPYFSYLWMRSDPVIFVRSRPPLSATDEDQRLVLVKYKSCFAAFLAIRPRICFYLNACEVISFPADDYPAVS